MPSCEHRGQASALASQPWDFRGEADEGEEPAQGWQIYHFMAGAESCSGEKTLAASRLAVKDCSGKSRSAPLTEGMNSSPQPSALRAEIKVCPLMLSRSLTFKSKQYCVIWLAGLHCACGVCLIFSGWRNAGDKVHANKNSLKKNAGDNAQLYLVAS